MFKEVVNIMPDDKFIDDYIRISEKHAVGTSSFLILKTDGYKYIKTENNNMFFIKCDLNFNLSNQLIFELNQSKLIILHSFNSSYLNFLNKISSAIKIIWIFWGIDGYNAITKSSYLPYDSVRMQYSKNFYGLLKSIIRHFRNSLILDKELSCRKIINRVDYCATFVKDDIKIAKTINPNIQALYFNYFNNHGYNMLENSVTKKSTTNDIFLGNSANPTNLHISALNYLSKKNFKGKIYCPLSYSGTKDYVENIVNFGFSSFGKNFIPLKEFLDYKEYTEIISKCDFVLMNHIRQQSVGTIFKSICLLKPVILNDKSFLRSSFLEWGLKIYDLRILNKINLIKKSDLLSNKKIVLEKLDEKNNHQFFNKILEISKSSINQNKLIE